MKGCLYTKIVIPQARGELHVFNTHAQSTSYSASVSLDAFCATYFARFSQLREIRDFINMTIKGNPEGPVLLCGDLNINATEDKDPAILKFVEEIDQSGRYSNIRPLITDEYGSLLKAI